MARAPRKSGKVTAPAKPPAAASLGVSIRMYRLGVGDCFLLRFRRPGGTYSMLIDCGVHQSQTDGGKRIKQVVADLRQVTGGKLDVVVATHEHWDHISGFSQAEDEFKTFQVGEVWAAWTENAADSFASSLREKRMRAIGVLGRAHARLRLAGRGGENDPLTSLLGFFGDTTGVKLRKAGDVLRAMAGGEWKVRYREPGEAPIELPGVEARIFVLGPPRDKEAIHRSAPRKGGDEVYSFGTYGLALDALERGVSTEEDPVAPFDSRFAIPLQGSKALGFFQGRYWDDGSPPAPPPERTSRAKPPHTAEERQRRRDAYWQSRVETRQGWRRIDQDWMEAATSLALKLDEDTNNTSLVLAIEFGPKDRGGPVLLFAADAQVGNWLSWQQVEWKDYHGRRITGPDLLRRTVLYKVGHHASHNATLNAQGLELMEALELALVPTDDKMAAKVGWGTLPWPKLLERLEIKAKKKVIRTDRDLGGKVAGVTAHQLYYEVEL